jgi:hypothetical protein
LQQRFAIRAQFARGRGRPLRAESPSDRVAWKRLQSQTRSTINKYGSHKSAEELPILSMIRFTSNTAPALDETLVSLKGFC